MLDYLLTFFTQLSCESRTITVTYVWLTANTTILTLWVTLCYNVHVYYRHKWKHRQILGHTGNKHTSYSTFHNFGSELCIVLTQHNGQQKPLTRYAIFSNWIPDPTHTNVNPKTCTCNIYASTLPLMISLSITSCSVSHITKVISKSDLLAKLATIVNSVFWQCLKQLFILYCL